jgi:hypothetical protein
VTDAEMKMSLARGNSAIPSSLPRTASYYVDVGVFARSLAWQRFLSGD